MFKRFQKFFDYYFKKIVPNGDTSMKLIRHSEGKRSKKKQEYKGIDLRVTFAGQQHMDIEKENDDPQRPDRDESHGSLIKMKHFSRGQQTVIAISLILALQRCDPAPFYLFDEIDSALDTNYR